VDSIQEKTDDERLLAAAGHATAILLPWAFVLPCIPYGGLIIPLILWLSAKEKTKYAAYQTQQALVYQAIMCVILTLWWLLYILSMCLLPLVIIFSDISSDDIDIVFPLGYLLILSIHFIGYIPPTVYGLYAAYQTYKGKDFRYPIIGKLLAKENKTNP
jgi:uncharacterized Tic20 family protein